MFDALGPENDIRAVPDHLIGPVQCRAGWELNDVDEVALILLGDEAGRRLRELDAGDDNQPRIDNEHDGGAAHQPPRQAPVPERDPAEAPIEAIEHGVKHARRQAGTCALRLVMRLE
jgi:hypothetical protein